MTTPFVVGGLTAGWQLNNSPPLPPPLATPCLPFDPGVSHSSLNLLAKYQKIRRVYTSAIQTQRYLSVITSGGSPYLR